MAPAEDNNDSGMESQEVSQAQEEPNKGSQDFSPDKKLEIEMDYDEEVIKFWKPKFTII